MAHLRNEKWAWFKGPIACVVWRTREWIFVFHRNGKFLDQLSNHQFHDTSCATELDVKLSSTPVSASRFPTPAKYVFQASVSSTCCLLQQSYPARKTTKCARPGPVRRDATCWLAWLVVTIGDPGSLLKTFYFLGWPVHRMHFMGTTTVLSPGIWPRCLCNAATKQQDTATALHAHVWNRKYDSKFRNQTEGEEKEKILNIKTYRSLQMCRNSKVLRIYKQELGKLWKTDRNHTKKNKKNLVSSRLRHDTKALKTSGNVGLMQYTYLHTSFVLDINVLLIQIYSSIQMHYRKENEQKMYVRPGQSMNQTTNGASFNSRILRFSRRRVWRWLSSGL
jgi:hypothetical protein